MEAQPCTGYSLKSILSLRLFQVLGVISSHVWYIPVRGGEARKSRAHLSLTCQSRIWYKHIGVDVVLLFFFLFHCCPSCLLCLQILGKIMVGFWDVVEIKLQLLSLSYSLHILPRSLIFYSIIYLVFIAVLYKRQQAPFIGEKSEVPRAFVTGWRFYSWCLSQPGLKPRFLDHLSRCQNVRT